MIDFLARHTAPLPRPAYLHRLPSLHWLWLLALAALFLGVGMGLRDPWPADEPRFALNALEMLKTGQFWIPHRAGEPYPDKPPIFMWATAASIHLTGSAGLGFLLPSLLGALGTLAKGPVLFLYWLPLALSARLVAGAGAPPGGRPTRP